MNPFEMISGPAMMGQGSAMNAFRQLRNAMLIQRENRYDQPYAPRMRPSRQPAAGGFMNQGGMMGGAAPDMSAFTYNPQMRAQAQAMGVNPLSPEQVNPYAALPNRGFFASHPNVSNALEGALFGAANTRGSDTIGEGISNVAQGFIQGRAQRANMLGQQFEAPFRNAEQLGRLKEMQVGDELHEAMIQHYRAQTEKLLTPTPEKPNEWEDFRDSFIANHKGQTIEDAAKEYANLKNPKPPAEKESEWTDFRDAYIADPKNRGGIEGAAKAYANLHNSKPPAPPTQFAGTYQDAQGNTRFMTPIPGQVLPKSYVPMKQSIPVNVFQAEEPSKKEDTADKEKAADIKQLRSSQSRKEIESELRRTKLLQMAGSKGKFDPSKLAVTSQDIDAEIDRQIARRYPSSPNSSSNPPQNPKDPFNIR